MAHSIDERLPAGDTSYDVSKATFSVRFNAAKSRRVLGLEYRSMEQTTRDIVTQFREKGWIV